MRALSLTPDGRELISASWDGTIRVWDVERLVLLETVETVDAIKSMAVDPLGAHVAVALYGGGIQLWRRDGWSRVGVVHGTE